MNLESLCRSSAVWLACAGLGGCAAMGQPPLRPENSAMGDCLDGPHCVSSQATDPNRHIEPLTYSGSVAAAQQALLAELEALPRTRVVTQDEGYIHAEVTSAILRAVDDVEFAFLPEQRIDVRSASRTGYYDFAVNRKRVERLRAGFGKRMNP